MNRLISPGILALVLILAAGVWLVISPWVMETQVSGAVWSPGTINNLAAGGILIGVSLVGIGASLGLALRDAVRMMQQAALDDGAH